MKIRLKKICLLVILSLIMMPEVKAQLVVDSLTSIDSLVNNFLNTNYVQVESISWNGLNSSLGSFDGTNTNLGINKGILLTTGILSGALGPNDSWHETGQGNSMGDPDISSLINFSTYDAASIELKIIPLADTLTFKIVFASEEYSEFLFFWTDACGIFLSGPGIQGTKNIALLPDDTTYISTFTLNKYTNSIYYQSTLEGFNPLVDSTHQFDGFSIPLTCKVSVIKDSLYTIKMVVADVGDPLYDSGLFISSESLSGDLHPHAEFTYDQMSDTINFQNLSTLASTYFWDFGDGSTSLEQNPGHAYSQPGSYLVSLVASQFSLADTFSSLISISYSNILQGAQHSFFKIHPNPAKQEVYISFPGFHKTELTLLDLTGRPVMNRIIYNTEILDISGLIGGVYTLVIKQDNEIIYKKLEVAF